MHTFFLPNLPIFISEYSEWPQTFMLTAQQYLHFKTCSLTVNVSVTAYSIVLCQEVDALFNWMHIKNWTGSIFFLHKVHFSNKMRTKHSSVATLSVLTSTFFIWVCNLKRLAVFLVLFPCMQLIFPTSTTVCCPVSRQNTKSYLCPVPKWFLSLLIILSTLVNST